MCRRGTGGLGQVGFPGLWEPGAIEKGFAKEIEQREEDHLERDGNQEIKAQEVPCLSSTGSIV